MLLQLDIPALSGSPGFLFPALSTQNSLKRTSKGLSRAFCTLAVTDSQLEWSIKHFKASAGFTQCREGGDKRLPDKQEDKADEEIKLFRFGGGFEFQVDFFPFFKQVSSNNFDMLCIL